MCENLCDVETHLGQLRSNALQQRDRLRRFRRKDELRLEGNSTGVPTIARQYSVDQSFCFGTFFVRRRGTFGRRSQQQAREQHFPFTDLTQEFLILRQLL